AVDAADDRVLGVDDEAKLGCDLDLVAAPGDRATDEQLVRVRAVDLRGVEESDAQLERAVDRLKSGFLVSRAIRPGHAHTPEPLRGDLEPLAAQLSPRHFSFSSYVAIFCSMKARWVRTSARRRSEE